ncbi:MAG: VWA domain-containing protein [Bryobacteraceae bacterium]
MCLALLAAGLAAAQQPVIRVDVNLVRILATVKNTAGDLVGTLAKDDFEVLDNGVPQQIAVFEHHTELPLSVAMMVDTSGSTAKELRYELESVNRFFKALFTEGNPEDKLALYSFNWEVKRWNFFTHNLGSLEKSLRAFKAEAGTAMYDAIYLASRDLEGREGRHAMIIVTDGGDTTSSTTYHQALQAAQMADAVIYPVLVMPITADAGRNIGGENALATMAASTGGRVFAPSIGPGLDAAFTEIIRELRTQYLLGYYPKNLPETSDRFHRLQIRTRRPDLRVLARSGYYGDSGSAAADPDARVTVTPQTKQEK